MDSGVFVGREAEIAQLLGGLEDARSGRGRLFLLAGEPGIGKSRLADELASRARAQGARVLWGRCWEAGGAPGYWPWVQLLRSCLRGQDPATVREQLGEGAVDLAQMLPEIQVLIPELPPPPSVDPESARFRLFDSTSAFLRQASAQDGLVLVIEDLHAADTASLLLLRFLAGQISDSHILVLATYRDVELTPDHPLTPALSELIREPSTRRLAIGGLGEHDVAMFIETAAQVTPRGQLISMLHRETNGNPLFLGEAVRLLAAEGHLDEMADPASLRIAVPAGIRAVIGRRVDHLGEACQQALALGSVLGPEFNSEVLRRLAELSPDQLLDVADEAVQAGLLVEVPGALGRFRFSHGLVRETLYEGLKPARRVRLHRRAGEVLEEMYGSDAEPHLAELSHHFFEAARGGDVAKAADYARRAGDQAAGALAYEEAAHLYRMALQAFDTQASPDQAARGELLIGLGDAQARMGELWSARETFLSAAAIARRLGAADMLGRAVLGYGGRVTYARVGDDPHLIPLLQDALVLLGGSDDRLRVRLLTRLACALRSSPDREHAAALSQQAVDVARRLGDPLTLGYALCGKCFATWWPENAQERLDIASEVLPIATEVDDGELMVEAHLARYAALADQGGMGQARAELAALVRIAEELRQPAQQWVGWALRCQLALLEGQYGLAEDLIPLGLESGPARHAHPGQHSRGPVPSVHASTGAEPGRRGRRPDPVIAGGIPLVPVQPRRPGMPPPRPGAGRRGPNRVPGLGPERLRGPLSRQRVAARNGPRQRGVLPPGGRCLGGDPLRPARPLRRTTGDRIRGRERGGRRSVSRPAGPHPRAPRRRRASPRRRDRDERADGGEAVGGAHPARPGAGAPRSRSRHGTGTGPPVCSAPRWPRPESSP